MTPNFILKRLVIDRLDWVQKMVVEIQALPLHDPQQFFADNRNIWTAESCLRRALEALLDVGRHILAKGFAKGVSEYKEIADELQHAGVLTDHQAGLLRMMAGYRNRMAHYYHEITSDEIYEIVANHLEDLTIVQQAYLAWLEANPDKLDDRL
ncbi:MAG: DUF86 domain-containing protein [Chloroflexi bacterium]|nr:DUF86 domain-containing protein [Chloroflexota bacterium]